MRSVIAIVFSVCIAWTFNSCKEAAGPVLVCDTICVKDSMKFVKAEHPMKPYVYISAANCNADTISWSYEDMGATKVAVSTVLGGTEVKLNPSAVGSYIQDTSYAWVWFNDCKNGRGYQLKLPFNKRDKLGVKASGINGFDPKFSIADGLIAYSDRGNIFTEDMATGKTAMMTFGERVEIDYDVIHDFIDSVHITRDRIYTKVKLASGWKELEKKIELK